ncbi:hypothetical protein [Streptomyces violascens]|nr:hypothetical protein [Streptomyces violascens]
MAFGLFADQGLLVDLSDAVALFITSVIGAAGQSTPWGGFTAKM